MRTRERGHLPQPCCLGWERRLASATRAPAPGASLTFQQPLRDAEGTHQVLGKVQVRRLLAQLREALGQSGAPQPVLPGAQRHVQQPAWGTGKG